MALIGLVELSLLYLQETFEAVPNMELQQEEFRYVSGEPRLTVWASGNDFEAFEAALSTDPTIEEYEHLSSLQERRLYQLVFPAARESEQLYPIALEQNIMPIRSVITKKGINLTARFPSREAVATFHDACQQRDISFRLKQLYHEESVANDGGLSNPYGVTEVQQESLLHALEAGYYDVPRQTKLASIAEDLGISTSALSTRLRRGQKNLLKHTLAQEPTT